MIKNNEIKEGILIEVSAGFRSHYPYVRFGKNKRLYWENEDGSISQALLTDDLLEYEFKITECKPDKIDEYKKNIKLGATTNEERAAKIFNYLCDAFGKINELTIAVNYLLEKSGE